MEELPTLTFLKQLENNYSASASPDTTARSGGGARLCRIITSAVGFTSNGLQEGKRVGGGRAVVVRVNSFKF